MLNQPIVDRLAVASGSPPGHAGHVTDATSERRLLLPLDVTDEEGGHDAVDVGMANEVPGVEIVEELDFGPAIDIGPEAFASEVEVVSELTAWNRITERRGTDVAGGGAELDEPVVYDELVVRVESLERLAELDGEAWLIKLGAQLFRIDRPVVRYHWRASR